MSESEIAKHTVCIARGTEMGHNMQPLIKNVFHQISIIIAIVFISKLENIHEHQQNMTDTNQCQKQTFCEEREMAPSSTTFTVTTPSTSIAPYSNSTTIHKISESNWTMSCPLILNGENIMTFHTQSILICTPKLFSME